MIDNVSKHPDVGFFEKLDFKQTDTKSFQLKTKREKFHPIATPKISHIYTTPRTTPNKCHTTSYHTTSCPQLPTTQGNFKSFFVVILSLIIVTQWTYVQLLLSTIVCIFGCTRCLVLCVAQLDLPPSSSACYVPSFYYISAPTKRSAAFEAFTTMTAKGRLGNVVLYPVYVYYTVARVCGLRVIDYQDVLL